MKRDWRVFPNQKNSRALYAAIVLSLALISAPARGADITLQGTIGTDSAVQLFNVAVATAGSVDIRSDAYAGGTTSTGTEVTPGGFDTTLTPFSVSGSFIEDNDEGAGAATEAVIGLAADARITTNLTAGNYLPALTQYDNFSIGNLADSSGQAGNPNFTADQPSPRAARVRATCSGTSPAARQP